MSLITHCLGFPRIGKRRELKQQLEQYWNGRISQQDLLLGAAKLRQTHWQQQAGLHFVTCGDFALYDQMLDLAVSFGVIPERFNAVAAKGNAVDLGFAMARGTKEATACEMTKWFNTNYHYLVPELSPSQTFTLSECPLEQHLGEAAAYNRKAVLTGPASFLYLSKMSGSKDDRLALLDDLLAIYVELLAKLSAMGVEWVQLDEPLLVLGPPEPWLKAVERSAEALSTAGVNIMLTTYFGRLAEQLDFCLNLPVQGLHLDAFNCGDDIERAAKALPQDKCLSVGAVNGRNIWRLDFDRSLERLAPIVESIGERLWIGSSCSLQHCPVDLETETLLDDEFKSWLAFSVQKLDEIALLGRALTDPQDPEVLQARELARHALSKRAGTARVTRAEIAERLDAVTPDDLKRALPWKQRAELQAEAVKLPLFPTTTIGSFPQTPEIRRTRLRHRRSEIDENTYRKAMQREIENTIREQEALGLDVLVHGEPERNDMVEYFGELLDGMATLSNGWVQSYGSRCVKPPVIYGDVCRSGPLTVEWISHAQSLTDKPVKGMLTGPLTMLLWSFSREDVPPEVSARQLALALRDEVADLEAAGISIIQIDEPAMREGLPLRSSDWEQYFKWAIESFLLASCGAASSTQIHSHMCYADFSDIIPQIAALDADVISLETARSNMELLDSLKRAGYPNAVGPGLYDIHSPRIPEVSAMHHLMLRALQCIEVERLWLNPDCGLKTRRWEEVRAALGNLVEVARSLRKEHPAN